MSGNVWEWTSSQWGKKVGSPDFTYKNWANQEKLREDLHAHALRVIRGGSWYDLTGNVRCAIRNGILTDNRYDNIGFRLVLGPPL